MKTKRTAKTADQKDLDTLWNVMRWAVDMRERSLCMHVLRQIDLVDMAVSFNVATDPPKRPRGRPRKAKVESDQLDLKIDGSAQPV